MIDKEKASETFDCQRCGACCTAAAFTLTSDGRKHPFVDLGPTEATKIEKKYPGLLQQLVHKNNWMFNPSTHLMRINPLGLGRCVALTGRVGRKVSCSIYEDRPSCCRGFEPGTEECLDARRAIFGEKK